jgi:hypothetical protein
MMKIVSAAFSGPSSNYAVNNPASKALLVNKEDARVRYDGPRSVSTSGRTSGVVRLRAIVSDISATADSNGDRSGGDVRLAQVTFVNRATNAPIATVNVSLLDSKDSTVGVAECDWMVEAGKNYTVGMIVTNYYSRHSTADNVTITVSKR